MRARGKPGAFFGRTAEVAALREALTLPGLVSVIGLPGSGKSRLVAEVFRSSLAVPEGVVVLDEPDTTATCAQVEAVLAGPARCVVVTGLRPLGLPGERTLRLGALTAPHEVDDPAVELFLARAAAASVMFRPAAADRAVIRQLCAELDELPLAIELASARVWALQPEAILAQLRGTAGLDVLVASGGRRDMRSTLDSGYCQLSEAERRMLACVSTFTDTFSTEAACAVADAGSTRDVVAWLTTLVECGFVHVAQQDWGRERFRLPPLIGRFAKEKLAALPEADDVRQRRVAFSQALATEAAAISARGDRAVGLGMLEHEWPEISATVAQLCDDGNIEAALQLSVDAAPFLLRTGFDEAAHGRFELTISQARRAPTTVSIKLFTRALLWSAVLCRLIGPGRPDAAWITARLQEGIALARTSDDQDGLLMGLEFTVLCAAVTGDLVNAFAAVDEGLALAEASADEAWLARFEGLAVMAAHTRGETAAAADFAYRAVSRALRQHDTVALLRAALATLGLPDAAETHAYQLLPDLRVLTAIAREERDFHSEKFLLGIEASRRLMTDDDVGAAQLCREHLELLALRRETDIVEVGLTSSILTVLAARRGETTVAARLAGIVDRFGPSVANASTPAKWALYEQTVTSVKDSLGARRWLAEQRVGADLGGAEAVRFAADYATLLSSTTDVAQAAPVELRRRERDVLVRLAAGLSNRDIAAELGLSERTVMHYVAALYKRIGVSSRAQAGAWAAQHGILSSPQQ